MNYKVAIFILIGWGWLPSFADSSWNIAGYFSSQAQKLEGDVSKVTVLKEAAANHKDASFRLFFDPPIASGLKVELTQFKNAKKVQETQFDNVNFGDQKTLEDFLNKTFTEGSTHSVLILSGHGTLWGPESSRNLNQMTYSTFGTDEGSDNDGLTIFELKNALTVLKRPLELLIFDNCNMGNIETLYELRTYARYIMASQFNVAAQSLNYQVFKQPFTTPFELAEKLIQTSFDPTMPDYKTFYLYDMAVINAVIEQMTESNSLKPAKLRHNENADLLSLLPDLNLDRFVAINPLRDFKEWLREIEREESDVEALLKDPRLGVRQNTFSNFHRELEKIIKNNEDIPLEFYENLELYRFSKILKSPPPTLQLSGLSVFFPQEIEISHLRQQLHFYEELEFAKHTLWGEKIQKFLFEESSETLETLEEKFRETVKQRPDWKWSLDTLYEKKDVSTLIKTYDTYLEELIQIGLLALSKNGIDLVESIYQEIYKLCNQLTTLAPNHLSSMGAKVFILRYKYILVLLTLAEHSHQKLPSSYFYNQHKKLIGEKRFYELLYEDTVKEGSRDKQFYELVEELLLRWLG